MLSRFPKVMSDNVDAVIRCADQARHIANATGDLPFRDLEMLQMLLENAKMTFLTAMSEGMKSPQAAEAFMISVNGPATLSAYQNTAVSIETAAAGWNAKLAQTLAELPNSVLISVIVRPDSQTKHIERPSFIPAIYADQLRQSAELGSLVAAFDAAGG